MAKVKKLSKEQIAELNKKALEKIETMEISKGRKSQYKDFLIDIKEVINKAIQKEIPFTLISKLIKDTYSINISVNVLKTFAKNHLGYIPKKKTKPTATASVKDKVSKKDDDSTDRIKANINDI